LIGELIGGWGWGKLQLIIVIYNRNEQNIRGACGETRDKHQIITFSDYTASPGHFFSASWYFI
jgi:hypothetical protein